MGWGGLLASYGIISTIYTISFNTVADTDASYDKCNKNNSCSLLFAEDIASDITNQRQAQGNAIGIFTDSNPAYACSELAMPISRIRMKQKSSA